MSIWGGLVTYYLLFVMELSTRRVHLAACTAYLGDAFMRQIARNLTDPFDGFLTGKRYPLMDRDPNFSIAFRSAFEEAGVKSVRLPTRSPNLNPHLERFHLSVKKACLSKMILFGEKMLRHAVGQCTVHYHNARNHQGLENRDREVCESNLPCGTTAGQASSVVWVSIIFRPQQALRQAVSSDTAPPARLDDFVVDGLDPAVVAIRGVLQSRPPGCLAHPPAHR